jgi:hypothetical protein
MKYVFGKNILRASTAQYGGEDVDQAKDGNWTRKPHVRLGFLHNADNDNVLAKSKWLFDIVEAETRIAQSV